MSKYLIGVFDDEHKLLDAIKHIRSQNISIHDVLTPFPVHGMDEAMGFHRSRITVAGFVFGLTGTLTALLGMSWIFTADWPINFGGKPYFSLPAFIPITFELTVLFSAIGMVAVFLISSKLYPGVKKEILDERATDDKFIMAFDSGSDNEKIEKLLKDNGAIEVHEKDVEKKLF